MGRCSLLFLLAVALAGLACAERDIVEPIESPPLGQLATYAEQTSPAARIRPRTWGRDKGRFGYACFESTLLPNGNYRYRTIPLSFSPTSIPQSGAVARFRYRERGENGVVQRLANCEIPLSQHAYDRMLARYAPERLGSDLLRVDTSSLELGLMMIPCEELPEDPELAEQCVCAETNNCFDLPPIENCGSSTSPEPCDPPDDDWPLPDDPPDDGDGGSPPGSGPGDDPCVDCDTGPDPCFGCDPNAYVTLTCSATTRGSHTLCQMNLVGQAQLTLGTWSFSGGPGTKTGGWSWSGMAVTGGKVRHDFVQFNGSPYWTQGTLSVSRRNWRWSSAQWQFGSGQGNCLGNVPAEVGNVWGRNHYSENCANSSIYPAAGSKSGYALSQVSVGPNSGLWYVSSVSLQMRRKSSIHPALSGGGDLYEVRDPLQASKCRSALGVTGYPRVTWYDYNMRCEGISQSVLTNMHLTVIDHEAYGGLNGPTGHQTQIEKGAATIGGDAWYAVEGLVAESSTDLHNDVTAELRKVDTTLAYAADPNHTVVLSSRKFSAWFWTWGLNKFVRQEVWL